VREREGGEEEEQKKKAQGPNNVSSICNPSPVPLGDYAQVEVLPIFLQPSA
jgi:hypothetical protein